MTVFVAILGTGKGTWAEVHGILALGSFEKAILFIDSWAAPEYKNEYKATMASINADATSEELTAVMHAALKEHAHTELELAVNIASGTGRQHAALLSAILRTGAGVRFVTFENGNFRVLD